jgi:hypothetical protein
MALGRLDWKHISPDGLITQWKIPMNYSKLIAKALNGRSVNKAAQEWGIPQKTLDRYAKGERMPDYRTALIIAEEAGVDPGDVMRICAAEEAKRKLRDAAQPES